MLVFPLQNVKPWQVWERVLEIQLTNWHTRCTEEACNRRCRRPGCREPGVHFLVQLRRVDKRWAGLHSFDCTAPMPDLRLGSVTRQAIEELRPGMAPDEITIARRVIRDALDRLERATTGEVVTLTKRQPVALLERSEEKKPQQVAAPHAITRARAQHLEWLASRKESRTA